jgi:hypothetical protein
MSTPKQKLIVAISNDFLKSFSGIPRKEQGKVREFFGSNENQSDQKDKNQFAHAKSKHRLLLFIFSKD